MVWFVLGKINLLLESLDIQLLFQPVENGQETKVRREICNASFYRLMLCTRCIILIRNAIKKAKTITKMVQDKGKARSRKNPGILGDKESTSKPEYKKVDSSRTTFKLPYLNEKEEFSYPKVPVNANFVDVFQAILPEQFLRKVWDSYDPQVWYESSRGLLLHSKFDLCSLYVYFAAYLWLMGNPHEVKETNRPLRDNIASALHHFTEIANGVVISPGTQIIEKLFHKFHLSYQFFPEICKGFRSLLKNIGQAVAGDEKLFFFTGESAFLRLVISKPDRIGLWFYELTCRLRDGSPFLMILFCATQTLFGRFETQLLKL